MLGSNGSTENRIISESQFYYWVLFKAVYAGTKSQISGQLWSP